MSATTPTHLMALFAERAAAGDIDGLLVLYEPDAGLLEREIQLACTHAVLTCLDREHRVAYILGDILEVESDEAATSATCRPRRTASACHAPGSGSAST
jgi:hypothetical protein